MTMCNVLATFAKGIVPIPYTIPFKSHLLADPYCQAGLVSAVHYVEVDESRTAQTPPAVQIITSARPPRCTSSCAPLAACPHSSATHKRTTATMTIPRQTTGERGFSGTDLHMALCIPASQRSLTPVVSEAVEDSHLACYISMCAQAPKSELS